MTIGVLFFWKLEVDAEVEGWMGGFEEQLEIFHRRNQEEENGTQLYIEGSQLDNWRGGPGNSVFWKNGVCTRKKTFLLRLLLASSNPGRKNS